MSADRESSRYTPTEAKYKGGAEEAYITYDLEQQTRGDGTALYPKVKRVYVPGTVRNWEVGTFEKQSGQEAYGVKLTYEKTREGHEREGYTAQRGETEYDVEPAEVEASETTYTKIIEVPEAAENIAFRQDTLPEKYQSALQDIR